MSTKKLELEVAASPASEARLVMALTAKQEAFCQGVVSGLSQADAYRGAYNARKMSAAVIQNKASLLMKKGEVGVRIQELRAPAIAELQYDLKVAMQEAKEAFDMAKSKENGGAMVAAVQLRARLNGLLVDRKEVRLSTVQQLSDEQLDQFILQKAKEAGVKVH